VRISIIEAQGVRTICMFMLVVVVLILTFGQVKAESKESISKCHAWRKECRAVCNCILIGFSKKKKKIFI